MLLCVILGFWSLAYADVEWKKWVGRVGVVSLLALIVAPVAWVYVCIPPPTPTRRAIAGKNGFDVMTGARDRFVLFGAIDYPDQATNTELVAAMKKNADHVDNGGVPIGDELWVGDGDLLLDSVFPAKPAKTPRLSERD